MSVLTKGRGSFAVTVMIDESTNVFSGISISYDESSNTGRPSRRMFIVTVVSSNNDGIPLSVTRTLSC